MAASARGDWPGFYRAALGLRPTETSNKYEQLGEMVTYEDTTGAPEVPELGDLGNIGTEVEDDRFTAAAWQPENGENSDVKDLDKRARAAVLRYDAAVDAFDKDKAMAWKQRRPQSRILGRELDKSYEVMDKLVGELSWARGAVARQREAGCLDPCCAQPPPCSVSSMRKNCFCSSFQGQP